MWWQLSTCILKHGPDYRVMEPMKSKGVRAMLKEKEVGFTTHHFTHAGLGAAWEWQRCAVLKKPMHLYRLNPHWIQRGMCTVPTMKLTISKTCQLKEINAAPFVSVRTNPSWVKPKCKHKAHSNSKLFIMLQMRHMRLIEFWSIFDSQKTVSGIYPNQTQTMHYVYWTTDTSLK